MDISFDVAAIEAQGSANSAGGESSITPPANTHRKMSQAAGVDSLSLNVWCDMPDGPFEMFMDTLAEAQKIARARHQPAIITLGVSSRSPGFLASVQERGSRSGAGFKYVLEIDGVRFLISGKARSEKRSNVMIEAMGGAMMRFGWSPRDLWTFAERKLREIGYRVDKHSISRIDPFVDVTGIKAYTFRKLAERGRIVRRASHVATFSVASEEQILRAVDRGYHAGLEACLTAVRQTYEFGLIAVKAAVKKARLEGAMDLATYGCGVEGSGLQVGKGNVVCRMYDKVFQLDRFHPERLDVMREAWGVAEDCPVTRVEFQLRGPWLRERNIKTLDHWDAKCRAVVEYLTDTWIVLADYDGHNKDRRTVDRRWRRVQALFRQAFGRRRKPIRRVTPQVDPAQTNRMIKTAVSLLRTASGRAFGPANDVGEYRLGVHQLIEQGVDMGDGWDAEYSGHLHRLHDYFQRGGFETEPTYPIEIWSRREELVDLAGMTGVRAMAGVPRG